MKFLPLASLLNLPGILAFTKIHPAVHHGLPITVPSSLVSHKSFHKYVYNHNPSSSLLRASTSSSQSKITIDNWILNSRGGITGINPINSEKVTTSEILPSDRTKIIQGATIQTTSGSSYKLGKEQTGRERINASFKGAGVVRPGGGIKASKTVTLPPVPKKKPPKPFANVNLKKKRTSSSTSTGSSTKTNPTTSTATPLIPVLDDWVLNKRTEQITGIISSSSSPSSLPDGSLVTTPELATSLAFAEEGFTVFTVDGGKYKLGTPKQVSGFFKTPWNLNRNISGNQNGRSGGGGASTIKIGGPIALSDWYVNSRGNIVGTVRESGYPNIKVGETISTGKILSDKQYVAKGYTVVSSTGKSYYLEQPQKQRKKTSNGTLSMKLDGPITLVDWYVNSKGDVMGKVSAAGIGYPDILVGEVISTGTIASDRTYIGEGYTIVSSVGNLFCLGKPKKVVGEEIKGVNSGVSNKKKPNAKLQKKVTSASRLPIPTKADPPKKVKTQTTTSASRLPIPSKKVASKPIPKVKAQATPTSRVVAKKVVAVSKLVSRMDSPKLKLKATSRGVPTLNYWTITGLGGVSGIISNSQNSSIEDGEVIATSKIITEPSSIREGSVVETKTGSKYKLGNQRK